MDISRIIFLFNLGFLCLLQPAKASLPLDTNCGVPQEPHVPPVKRIVGGQESLPFNWPWMAALKVDGVFQCGGTLVRTNNGSHVILTAAHCVDGAFENPARWEVRMGFVSRNGAIYNPYYQSRKVIQIHKHPQFSPSTLENDIAVLTLDGVVNETMAVYPACVTRSMHAAGEPCVTLGWGQVDANNLDSNSDRLHEIYKYVQPSVTCSGAFGTAFNKISMMCAGDEHKTQGPCLRDSGGPLLCARGHKWYLTGIISWSFICGLTYDPPVYTNVFQYVVSGWLSDVADI
uniref:Trypsin-like serine protease n=1 Tax=Pinctada fucata TaxID=50426 RepID=D3XLA3_PINFU|nr:trypsin-like serine protease [Pinctada fucata]